MVREDVTLICVVDATPSAVAAEAFHALIKEVEKTNGLLDSDHQGLCVIL